VAISGAFALGTAWVVTARAQAQHAADAGALAGAGGGPGEASRYAGLNSGPDDDVTVQVRGDTVVVCTAREVRTLLLGTHSVGACAAAISAPHGAQLVEVP